MCLKTNVNRGWTGKCSDPDAIEKENGVQLTVESVRSA